MDFKFYIPNIDISKASPTGSQNYKIRGLASTPTKDKEGDVITQNFDLSEFKWINYEHGKNPHETIGEITKARVTSNGLEIEGELYADNALAKEVYALAMNMQKSGNGNKLGLSVEGRTLERDSKDKNKVKKAQLFAVAICKTPMNGDTFVDITKSLKQQETQIPKKEMDGLETTYTADAIQKAYEALGVDSAKNDLEKGGKMKKEIELNIGGEDEEEDNEEMPEAEMKKAMELAKDLKAKGRSTEQIVKALNAYGFSKDFTEKDLSGVFSKSAKQEEKEEAIDLVKGFFDSNFKAIGSIFKGFEANQAKQLEAIENLQAQIDAFGAKTGLSKSDIAKAVRTSPMDGKGNTLDLRNPSHKQEVANLAEKHLNLEVASSVELTGFISKAHRDELKKATGYEIVG